MSTIKRLFTVAALLATAFVAACSGGRVGQQESSGATVAAADATTVVPTGGRNEALPPARGMWIWKTSVRLAATDGISSLLESCREAGVNEAYLSIGSVLEHPRLPGMVTALREAGIRVEALTGEAGWYLPERRPSMLAAIDAIAAYNARVPVAARFAAVHLDIEPHQLPQNKGNHGFLPALADTLDLARRRASARGLDTSADLPRFALEENGAAFARAVPRIFVMLYELRDRDPAALADASGRVLDATYLGPPAAGEGRMVIGVSVDDYTIELDRILGAVEGAQNGRPRYAGWAIHDEARYRARFHH